MIGCFFGKKIHKLKNIKPQELIDFQNRYYDDHVWLLPEPRALARIIVFSFLFFFSLFLLGFR